MHGRYPHLRLIAIMSFALGFLVLPGPIKSVQAQESALIVNADELSPERFRELFPRFPDSAVIESHGKRTTVGEIRAKLQEQQAAIEVELERLERRALADLEKHRAAFHESEKARLDEARKEAFAAFERLSGTSPVVSPEIRVIQREMWELWQRSKTASPKEEAELERRAHELVNRYSQIAPPAYSE
jgi:hypothetical protein